MGVLRAVLVLSTVAVLLSGCGDGAGTATSRSQGSQELNFGLDGQPGPHAAGIILASRFDYFADAGFGLRLRSPAFPVRPVPYVDNGAVDLSISHMPEVILAQDQGLPIVAIASLVPEPTMAMIWLKKSGIDEIADLKGKTIAIPGVPFQEALLGSALSRAGLSLDEVEVDSVAYNLVPALISGRADAIFGGTWNVEGVELETRGFDPVITRVSELGIPAYEELVLIARRDRLAKDPQGFREILAAVERGNAAALADPEEAIDAVTDSNEASGEKALEAEVEATLPLLSTTGEMDPQAAEDLVAWMHEQGMIQREPPVSSLLDNDYLPES